MISVRRRIFIDRYMAQLSKRGYYSICEGIVRVMNDGVCDIFIGMSIMDDDGLRVLLLLYVHILVLA